MMNWIKNVVGNWYHVRYIEQFYIEEDQGEKQQRFYIYFSLLTNVDDQVHSYHNTKEQAQAALDEIIFQIEN